MSPLLSPYSFSTSLMLKHYIHYFFKGLFLSRFHPLLKNKFYPLWPISGMRVRVDCELVDLPRWQNSTFCDICYREVHAWGPLQLITRTNNVHFCSQQMLYVCSEQNVVDCTNSVYIIQAISWASTIPWYISLCVHILPTMCTHRAYLEHMLMQDAMQVIAETNIVHRQILCAGCSKQVIAETNIVHRQILCAGCRIQVIAETNIVHRQILCTGCYTSDNRGKYCAHQ